MFLLLFKVFDGHELKIVKGMNSKLNYFPIINKWRCKSLDFEI